MTFSPMYALHRLTFQQLRSSNEVADRPWNEIKNALQKLNANVAKKVMVLRPYLAGMSLAIALMSIACASIFVVIASESLSPGAIAFNRLLISGLVFGGWYYATSAQQSSWLTDDPTERSISHWQVAGLFLLAGTSFAGSVGCAAWSLTQTTVANSTLLNNMMPIFSALGAWLVLGRTFSHRFIAGLGVAIVGVIVLGVQDLNLASDQLMGDGAALLAAILLATALLCIERLRAEFPTSAIMAGLSLVGTVTLSPLVLTNSDTLFPLDAQSGLAVLAVALVSQVMGHGLLAYSLKQLSSGLVSVLMLTIPVMSALLAALLFGQNLGWMNGVAFVIVLSGIYLAVSQPQAQEEAE